MTWKDYEIKQQEICTKQEANWKATPPDTIIGLAKDMNQTPIYGIHYLSGWMIWSSENTGDDDFFEPTHAAHLVDVFPNIIHYLGLDAGWTFLIDKAGYEDVWFDENYLIEQYEN